MDDNPGSWFHQGRTDRPGYDPRKLRRWADRIATVDAGEVFVYFNNDTGGAAVRDALAFRELLSQRDMRVPAPAPPRPNHRTA